MVSYIDSIYLIVELLLLCYVVYTKCLYSGRWIVQRTSIPFFLICFCFGFYTCSYHFDHRYNSTHTHTHKKYRANISHRNGKNGCCGQTIAFHMLNKCWFSNNNNNINWIPLSLLLLLFFKETNSTSNYVTIDQNKNLLTR